MRAILILSMLSVPAFASKMELEPRATAPGQVLTCTATATLSKEVKHGACVPAASLPPSVSSLGERKAR